MICLDKRKIAQHIPMNCHSSKIGHSYEAFTYLFGRNIFIHLPSSNRNPSVDLLKCEVSGSSSNNVLQVSEKWEIWVPQSQTNSKFPMTAHFKRSAEEFLWAERRQMKVFWPNRYVNVNASLSYEWIVIEQQLMWGSATQFFLAQTDHQSWGYLFNGKLPLQSTQNQPITTEETSHEYHVTWTASEEVISWVFIHLDFVSLSESLFCLNPPPPIHGAGPVWPPVGSARADAIAELLDI